jgi:hypothetical protein
MTMNRYSTVVMCLLIVALAGCSTPSPAPTATAGPAEPESSPVPAPGTSSTMGMQPFVDMAEQAGCARDRNRLLLIDGAMVLWERRDLGCADASYEIGLFGASPDAVLCRHYDSIAGPMLSCEDESLLPMFETMTENIDEANLGLGPEHTVEPIWQSG